MIRASLIPGGALLALYSVFYLQFALQLLATPFELDQGEGYDVWSAWVLLQGHLPYTDNQSYPYYSSNYPPLWSGLVAVLMAWLGPGLAPGRAVSIVSALLAAVLVGLAASGRVRSALEPLGVREQAPAVPRPPQPRDTAVASHRTLQPCAGLDDRALRASLGRDRAPLLAGLLAAGFFLGSPYVFHTTPLARVNATALLFALLGLLLLVRPTRGRVALGLLALLAAGFTKPTAVDAAAAAVASLLFRSPRLGLGATIILAALGLVGLLLLNLATGGTFWLNVVAANANPFELDELAKYLANAAVTHGILFALALAELRWSWARGDRSPWALYLPIAAVASLAVGKWGAGESYFLGLVAASSVLAGAFVARIATTLGRVPAHPASPSASPGRETRDGGAVPGSPRHPLGLPAWSRAPLLAVALFAHALLSAHGPLSDVTPWLPDRGRQAGFLGHPPSASDLSAAAEIVAALREAPGPSLSEAPSFAILAGEDVVGNATHLRNLYEAGLWDPAGLVADVRARRFGAVVLSAELFPTPVLDAIGQAYYLDRTLPIGAHRYRIFLPRRE